jgi:NhaA family Na+:H+ antiporter
VTERPALLFGRGSRPEVARATEILRKETVGGALLLLAAAIALGWANSPWSSSYTSLQQAAFGPEALHLHLTAAAWAADGLLAVFFFLAGLELKREFVAGDLRDPRRAALPVAAAVGGMLVPALVYLAISSGDTRGWAVPTATDIAFAVAVLAVIGTHLPPALRTFLLTLAVVDDLLAILIIAVVFTQDLAVGPLALAIVSLALFALAVRRADHGALLIPLALTTWALVHASGVHATVAGILLAFTIPVGARADQLEHRLRPVSAGFAVPVFALLAAGVTLRGLDSALTDPVTVGIIAGLVIGKPVGIGAATYLVSRFTRAQLDPDLSWWDVLGLSLLGGIGFTVSLLIGELAFDGRGAQVQVGVLAGSLLAAVLAAGVLRSRNRTYRALQET